MSDNDNSEQVDEPKVEDSLVDATHTPTRSHKKKKVKVKLLGPNVYNGKYAVLNVETQKGYLIPAEDALWSTNEQDVDQTVIDQAELLYNWDEEIENIRTSDQQLRIALWTHGYVKEEDAKKLSLRQILATLINRGVFPITK